MKQTTFHEKRIVDLTLQLNELTANAAECKLLSDLATDAEKRALFLRLAEHLKELGLEIARTIQQRHEADTSAGDL